VNAMPTESENWPGNHYSAGGVHGPVRMFLDDDGRLAFYCDVDGTGWLLQIPRPRKEARRSGRIPAGHDTSEGGPDELQTSSEALQTFPNEPDVASFLRRVWPDAAPVQND
jgi:hypothetical protein